MECLWIFSFSFFKKINIHFCIPDSKEILEKFDVYLFAGLKLNRLNFFIYKINVSILIYNYFLGKRNISHTKWKILFRFLSFLLMSSILNNNFKQWFFFFVHGIICLALKQFSSTGEEKIRPLWAQYNDCVFIKPHTHGNRRKIWIRRNLTLPEDHFTFFFFFFRM